ncbi:HAD domain-containing protein [Noviherbaspirillum cavernae]|nr:HAD domain-containing protein [Noviherbaspirillum cavernae]
MKSKKASMSADDAARSRNIELAGAGVRSRLCKVGYMRPVIFLDMDDVLVISREFTSFQVISAFKAQDLDYPELWAGLVSPEARFNLAELHNEFQPEYVISSNWSSYLSQAQLQEIFQRTGLSFVAENMHAQWTTPKGTGSPRVTEVENWIVKYRQPEQAVLVLDDHESGWNLHECQLDQQGLVVLCDEWTGFTAEKLLDAQRLLRAQLRDEPEP